MNSINDLSPTPNILFPHKLKQHAFGATADTPLLGATAPNPFAAVAAAPPGSLSPNTPGLLGVAPGLLGATEGVADVGYSSSQLLERSIDIYGGLEYLTLVLFSVVQNYDALLKKISVDLNTNRRGYNSLMAASEKVNNCMKKLRVVSASAGGKQEFLNPTTCVQVDPAVEAKAKDGATAAIVAKAAKYSYPDADASCTNATAPIVCLLTEDDLQGLFDVIHTLDPASKITMDGLKTKGPGALPVSKIKEIYDDAQQRLVYMNAVSVQKGGLIQAAETNYQIVVQFSAGVIAVIKTVGGAIAQRL